MSPTNSRTHERELTSSVPTCDRDGRVVPSSVGFSRKPQFDGHVHGHFGRRKRWEYWAVTSKTHVFSLTLADLDFAGLASAWLVDLQHGTRIEAVRVLPPGRVPDFPDRVGGDLALDFAGFSASIRESGRSTLLEVAFGHGRDRTRARLIVDDPVAHESLSVLVPFADAGRFQLTSKHVGRPARGTVTRGGEILRFGLDEPAYGFLDHGRGVFPHHTRWNWSAGAQRSGDHEIGWNLGAQWTDGSGVTENGVFVDGKLDKLGEEARFTFDPAHPERPWRVETPRSGAVSLELRPLHVNVQNGLHGPIGARIWLAFGTFHGSLVDGAGRRHAVDGAVGWAEEFHARW